MVSEQVREFYAQSCRRRSCCGLLVFVEVSEHMLLLQSGFMVVLFTRSKCSDSSTFPRFQCSNADTTLVWLALERPWKACVAIPV
jgi:hypothetical protein